MKWSQEGQSNGAELLEPFRGGAMLRRRADPKGPIREGARSEGADPRGSSREGAMPRGPIREGADPRGRSEGADPRGWRAEDGRAEGGRS